MTIPNYIFKHISEVILKDISDDFERYFGIVGSLPHPTFSFLGMLLLLFLHHTCGGFYLTLVVDRVVAGGHVRFGASIQGEAGAISWHNSAA